MRLLPERDDHGGGGAAEDQAEADACRHRRCDHQSLPLRHLSAGAGSDPRRCQRQGVREGSMTQQLTALDRRSFLVGATALGGGLSLGLSLPIKGAQAAEAAEVNAWVVIKVDDMVVIRIARREMGRGPLTGLAQLVGEELECDWSKVTAEFATPGQNVARNRVWKNFSTGGSRGIRESHEYVRQGGAAAREMLIQAAANGWKVPASECTAQNSVIAHKPSGRKTSYGKVADAGAKLEPPKQVTLKEPKDWKLIGKPVKRLDTADKVQGKTIYGIDVKLPGMLIAAIRDCPVNGGKVKSFEAAKVAGMPGGKKVVAVGESGVAVIAGSFWNAQTAVSALPIRCDAGQRAKVPSG